jgi:curli biogenesis system outer membrane secretion channel CsgG
MNQAKITLAIAAVIAAAALTTAAFTVPQQVMAYKHNHHNNHNDIKVDQQINQANFCDNGAACINDAQNNFGPQQVQLALPVMS